MSQVRNTSLHFGAQRVIRAVVATLVLVTLLVSTPGLPVEPAGAAPADNFSLAKTDNRGGEALIGEEVTYTLNATGDHGSGAFLYNLSFRDVLPVGVNFVSASPAPTEVLVDVPSLGETTVIWSNVSDLPANSQSSVSITVDTNPDFAGGTTGSGTVPVGSFVTNNAEAVASLDAFTIPDYDVATGAFTGDFDGAATASDTVEIIPFRVEKTAADELLRGVHANGFDGASGTTGQLYTVVVKNNPDYAVNAVTLVDTLHPGLEFLGCDTYYPADNTTVADEWLLSGPVATGAGCGSTPTSVDTGIGGETIVSWVLGNLAPGATVTLTYQAGIPLFENRPFTGVVPAAALLGQGRNLDNNTGSSTGEPDRTTNPDPELLTAPEQGLDNTAVGTGTYTPTGAVGTDDDTHVVESEDLVINKSMSGALVHGTTVATTLTITTSEYRDFTDLVVRDLLPSSLCFLGGYNADNTSGGSDWRTNDCPGAGSVQSTIDGTPVNVASVRELPGGGPYGTGRFEIVWDFADLSNAQLANLDADGTLTITYSTVVREFYRGGLARLPGEPVLAGDSVTNEAEVSGPDTVADASLSADPVDPDGGIDGDTSSASIGNSLPSINKRISVKTGPLDDVTPVTGATCANSYDLITWSDGDPTPELGYGPTDIVCFELGATFGPDVNYEGVQIQDLLPPGYTYINGSATRVATVDTIPGTTFTESPSVVSFTVSGSGVVDDIGNEFRWVLAAQLNDNTEGVALDINANLQKLIHNNNGGLVFQLRDQAAAEWTEPEVRLAKGVDHVNTAASNGADFDGSLTGGSTAAVVVAGDAATFRVDVWNIGNTDALATEVQDHLPADFDCGDIATIPAISNGGTCASGIITWTGLTVAASTGGGDVIPDNEYTAPITLTYVLDVPSDIDPNQSWTNTAGIATYQATTNTAGPYSYYPANNIDTANAGLVNTNAADDPAYLVSPAPTVTKTQQSGIDEGGNAANASLGSGDDEATIGELIQYQVTATIPAGTTVYNAEIRDVLPTGLVWFTGNGLFNGTVSNLQPTVTGTAGLTGGTVVHSAGTVTYELPDPWNNAAGSGEDSVTITFYAQVDDIVANQADPSATRLRNRARFDWNDAAGADRVDIISNRVDTYVVEPKPVIVKDHVTPAGNDVLPGQTITYRITVTNPTTFNNVSVAHDITVVDTVPAGITPLGIGSVPVTANGDLVPSTGVNPAGLSAGVWSETNRTITWTPADWSALDAIDPDGTVRFTYDTEVDDPGIASSSLTNTAALTAYGLDQNLAPTEDPNEADGRTYTANDTDTVNVPLAAIDKDIEPFNLLNPADDIATLTVGEPVDYQVTVTIPAGTAAYDATIFDDLPASLDFDNFGSVSVSNECEIFDAATGMSTGTPLVPGGVEKFNPVGLDAQLAAWFIGDVYANGDCDVTVEYTVHVNDNAVDTNTITNDAELFWNATNQVASQTPTSLPAGYDDPDSISWSTSSGPASESFVVTEPALEIDKDVTDVSGAALANPTCDTTAGNNDSGSNDADGTGANGCDTMAGASLRYTLTVTSTGTSDAHDITVVDTVPNGLTPLAAVGGTPVNATGQTITGDSGSIGLWNQTARTITWTIAGPLAAAPAATVDYDAVVDASDTLTRGIELTNTADIPTFYGIALADRVQIVTDNGGNDDIITYGNDPAATRGAVTVDDVTVEVHFPELTINKAATVGQDSTDVRLDQPFSWTITVTNTDSVASAFNIDITDVLPDGWTYDVGSATVTTPHNGGPVAVEPTCVADSGTCGQAAVLNIETLSWTNLVAGATEPVAPGETITIVLTATPQSAVLTPDQTTGESFTGYDAATGFAHTNAASVAGEDATGSASCCDPDGAGPLLPENYADSDDDDVYIARADIEVDKAITPVEVDGDPDNGPYWFGSYVNYTITVDNLGPDAATNVTLSDVLDPTELAFDAIVSIDQGTFDDSTNIWTVGTVADGASLQLTIRTRLVALGGVTNIAQAATSDQYDSDSTPGNDILAEDDQDSVSITVVPTSLGDYVWLDLNGDGIQDGTEPGIPNVEVVITWLNPADGTPRSYTTTTGANGSYGVPLAVGLPADTDITVTVNPANSPSLAGLTPSFDRDGIITAHTSTDQITTADTTIPGGAIADLDFDYGYRSDATQTIGDTIWWDQDNSGGDTNGVAEPRLPNIDVTATWAGWDDTFGTTDDIAFTDTTDSSGNYLFDTVPPGRYRVVVDDTDLPAGLNIPTYDLNGTATAHNTPVTLDPGETQLDVDFSYTGPGSIGDTVWFDYDNDGAIDVGEPGLGGVTVTLNWVDGGITLTTTTAPDGTYSFDNLPYGDYTITVNDSTLPGGLSPTFDADGTVTAHTSATTLTALSFIDNNQDFGYRGAGSIGDTVFFDIDGTETDGIPDAGDSGLGTIDVTVTWAGADLTLGTSDDFSYTDTTDGSGNYLVTELPHGDYTITVDDSDLPTGLTTATFDANGTGTPHVSATTLDGAGPDDLTQDFAYTGETAGLIGDTVWFDQNNNGLEDLDEVGFSGVTVTLTWFGPDGVVGGTDNVVQTVDTDATGTYLFDNLPEGNFSVVVDDTTLPFGLTQTFDDDGLGSPNATLVTLNTANPSDLDQDFGYTGVGSLGDHVWHDIDNSATIAPDPSEPGIAGAGITVVWTNPQGTNVTYPLTTDANGDWGLPNLPHGSYTVTVDGTTLPSGMVPTYDADGTGTANTSTVILDATTPDNPDQDFSYTGAGSLGDTVWFDQNNDGATDPAGSGVFDDQDQPLDGIDITVTWGGPDGIIGDDATTTLVDESIDDLVYPATTDANGEWLVPNLPHGPYTVTVDTDTLPPGITVETYDNDGIATASTSAVILDATVPDNADLDFSYTGAGSLGDTIWFDLDGNGTLDTDEVGLAGITVTLTYTGPDGSTVTVATTTANDGTYLFENLPFDTDLTVTVDDTTLPSGFVPTFDDDDIVTPHVSVTTLTAAEPNDLDQDFGYNGAGTIGDTVFFDRDTLEADGIPDLFDIGIPNVDVAITWSNPTGGDDLTVTVTTDANGNYQLTGLPHGDYTITLDPATLPAGTTATFDADGLATANTSTATLDAATPDDLNQDFSVTGTGSLGDTIWRDENADGVLDPDENLLEGVTVEITYVDPISGLTYTETTVTGPDGTYIFDDMPAGDYTVSIDTSTLPDGYVPTYDVDGAKSPHIADVILGDGEDRDDVDFGYRPEADLGIDKSHDGGFVIGADNTWTLTVTNNGPASAVAPVTITDTLPANTAFVEASGDNWSCVAAGQIVTCTYVDSATGDPAAMASGSTSSVDLTVSVAAAAAASVTNSASVDTPTVDIDPSNDLDTDEVSVPLSILDIDKVLDGELTAGRDASYLITVTNLGPSPTRGDIIITDDLPAGLTYKSATSTIGGVTCIEANGTVRCTNPAAMEVGDTWTVKLTVTVTATAGGQISNDATVEGGNDVDGRTLSPKVLSDIYNELNDPGSSLASDLGLAPNANNSDVAAAIVQQNPAWLAFSGASSQKLVIWALLLLATGGALVAESKRRRITVEA